MATTDFARTTLAPVTLFALVADLRVRVATAQKRRAVYRRTYSELAALGDRELADLGIARAQIPDIAKEASDEL